jgi:5-methylcytosine-specific restriction endonuclease McrA
VPSGPPSDVRPVPPSRHLPREVKREVWRRDAGRCAFRSPTGRRCTEDTFLEFHHIQPYAKEGPATVANVSLRCWRHNQYEAELVFGPHGSSIVRARSSYALPRRGPSRIIGP